VVEVAGELTAEYERYNTWVHSRKGVSSSADLWNPAAFADQARSDCAQAWAQYVSELDAERAVARQALLDTLREYVHGCASCG